MSANPKAEPLFAPMSSTLQKNKRSRLSDTNLSDETWFAEILPCCDLKGLSKLSRTSTFFNNFWQRVKRACHDQIDVKQNAKQHLSFHDSKIYLCCPTIERAMALAQQISKIKSWNTALVLTETKLVKIRLDKGVHKIVGGQYGFMNVTCSHITFVGKGKAKTTLLGGFYVNGKQNVKIEQLAVTNHDGLGLFCKGSGTNVDVTECFFKKCQRSGMSVSRGATVTATRCDFMENGTFGVACGGANTKVRLNDSTMHHNGRFGLIASDHAVVDLHGTKTDIHSNKQVGIAATKNAKVNIHLPSQHNTTHDNVGGDRVQQLGGAIANINAT